MYVEAEQKRQDGGWRAIFVVPAKEESVWDDDNPEFRYVVYYKLEVFKASLALIRPIIAERECLY